MAIKEGISFDPASTYEKVHNKASKIAPQSGPTYEDEQDGIRYYFVGDGKSPATTVIYNQYKIPRR